MADFTIIDVHNLAPAMGVVSTDLLAVGQSDANLHKLSLGELSNYLGTSGGLLEFNDLDGFLYDVQYNSTTHTITFYQQNEPNIVIDLPIEQLIKGVQLVGDDLVFTFEDGSTVTVPLNTLLVGVVKSVNGLTPNSQGEIVLNITDIPNLSSELANKLDIRMAGLVSNLTQPEKDAILTKLGVVNNIVQVLGLSGNTITLSNGGGSISLNIANIGGLQNALDLKANVNGNNLTNIPNWKTYLGFLDSSDLIGYATETWANGRFSLLGHTHPISDVVGLQNALNNKVDRAGDTMSGTLVLQSNVEKLTLKSNSVSGNNYTLYKNNSNVLTHSVGLTGNNNNYDFYAVNSNDWNFYSNGNQIFRINEGDVTSFRNLIIPNATASNHAVNLGQLANYALLSQVYTQAQSLALFVGLNGVQTIADTKTFTSSPIVPTATLNGHAVNLGQLNNAISSLPTPIFYTGSNGIVLVGSDFQLNSSSLNSLALANSAVQPNVLNDYIKKDGSVAMTSPLTTQDALTNNQAVTLGQLSSLNSNFFEKTAVSVISNANTFQLGLFDTNLSTINLPSPEFGVIYCYQGFLNWYFQEFKDVNGNIYQRRAVNPININDWEAWVKVSKGVSIDDYALLSDVPTDNNQLSNGANYTTLPLVQSWIGTQNFSTQTLTAGTGISIIGNTINNTSPNVQADWNATSGLAQILNKPTIPSQLVYTGSNGINVSGTVISPTYGTTAGTIAQGNDARINNGQTAFGWGNHAGLYPLLSGSYANPTWITAIDWSKITNAPTIPTVGNGQLSFTAPAGLSISGTFSANQSGNTVVPITWQAGYQGFTTAESTKLANLQNININGNTYSLQNNPNITVTATPVPRTTENITVSGGGTVTLKTRKTRITIMDAGNYVIPDGIEDGDSLFIVFCESSGDFGGNIKINHMDKCTNIISGFTFTSNKSYYFWWSDVDGCWLGLLID